MRTAGTNQPNNTDFQHYHYLINGNGLLTHGKYKPEDNLNCQDGKYAAHTEMGNTGSIGISLCGMYVPNGVPVQKTKYPLTKIQCERCFKLIAELCKKYNIPITPITVLTHYEFDCNRGKKGRKIDITFLPYEPNLKSDEIGDFIREKAKWYLNN